MCIPFLTYYLIMWLKIGYKFLPIQVKEISSLLVSSSGFESQVRHSEAVCVEFVISSLRSVWVSFGYAGFLPQSKDK